MSKSDKLLKAVVRGLLNAGTKDKRFGNKDNWEEMGLKQVAPRYKNGRKYKR